MIHIPHILYLPLLNHEKYNCQQDYCKKKTAPNVISSIPSTKGNYMIRRLSVCYLDDKSVVRPKLVFNSNAKDYPIKLKLKQTHS